MADYVYPAIFHFNSDDGSYTITYPDLPGCISEGKNLENALYMAQDALQLWIEVSLQEKESIPPASSLADIHPEEGEFVNFIRVSIKDNRAVRRTVSLPKWLDEQVSAAGISLSRVLQEALKERLGIEWYSPLSKPPAWAVLSLTLSPAPCALEPYSPRRRSHTSCRRSAWP